jgi:hypothetical protein
MSLIGVLGQASVRQRGSVTSATFKIQRTRTDGSTSRLRSNSNLTFASLAEEDIIHPVEPRACTAMLPPVMVRPVITRKSLLLTKRTGEACGRASTLLAGI